MQNGRPSNGLLTPRHFCFRQFPKMPIIIYYSMQIPLIVYRIQNYVVYQPHRGPAAVTEIFTRL